MPESRATSPCPGTFRIGTSGWQYDHWRGGFYPDDLPKRAWFERYAEAFDTVEINNTFYRLPSAETFEAWREQAPDGFLYAVKFSRYGTHRKRLKEPENSVDNFVERARLLEGTLGPVLVQLPPRWKADPGRLRAFLDRTPGDLRWTVEVRDERWLIEPVFDVLRAAGAALCLHDRIRDHPWLTTTDWTYIRYHGVDYGGSYTQQRLSADADRIAGILEGGRDVYVYFNNDLGGHAIEDARRLRRFVRSRCGAG